MNLGHEEPACGCDEFHQLNSGAPDGSQGRGFSRRAFLGGVLALGGGLVISAEPGLDYALAAPGEIAADVVIMISMRGGMDGLMAVPVLGDPLLASYRPKTSLADSQNLNLDNHFGLHKNLTAFKSLFDQKELAIVHAVGTPVGTRSHFDDQFAIEMADYDKPDTPTGWQTRFLKATGSTEVLSGVSISQNKPVSLRGATQAGTFEDLNAITITNIGDDRDAHLNLLRRMHKFSDHAWAKTALGSIDASERLRKISVSMTASYPDTPLGRRFKTLATLLRGGMPIKTANIDFAGSLDVHSAAGIDNGIMAENFKNLNDTIAAFKQDLGEMWANTTILTITEFGRRLQENASAGLDHGWASAMFVMGGGVKGGQVVAKWPGIDQANLHNGDLAVTLDYRDVISNVLRHRGGLSMAELSSIFPGFKSQDLGLAKTLA